MRLEYHGSRTRHLPHKDIEGGQRNRKQTHERVQRREEVRDSAQDLRVEDLGISQLGSNREASEA